MPLILIALAVYNIILSIIVFVTIREVQLITSAIKDIDERSCNAAERSNKNSEMISNHSSALAIYVDEIAEHKRKLEKVFEIATVNRNELVAMHMRERNNAGQDN